MPPALASREYKLMLRAARFAGSEAELIAQVAAFWGAFGDAVASHGIATDGALSLSKERPVTFYDTANRHLNNKDLLFRDYVFRARPRADGTAKVTLKYRHPDRLVAGDRNLTATKKLLKKKRKIKFEKDIKPVQRRMRSLYSYSSSGRTKDTLSVDTVGRHRGAVPRSREATRRDAGRTDGAGQWLHRARARTRGRPDQSERAAGRRVCRRHLVQRIRGSDHTRRG